MRTRSAPRESNPPGQLGRLAPEPIGQGREAAVAGVEPANHLLNREPPYRLATPQETVGRQGSHGRGSQSDQQSAQRESNPHFRHGKATGCRYIMGAKLTCRIVKDRPTGRPHRAAWPTSSTTNPVDENSPATKKARRLRDTGLLSASNRPRAAGVTSAADTSPGYSPDNRRNRSTRTARQ
jgi:hypothetical protein